MSNKILLLEDEVNVGSTLAEFLESLKFEVIWFKTILELKNFLNLSQEMKNINLILLDVGLPDGSGFDVAKLISENFPHLPIVFLTSFSRPEDRIHGLELGAQDYITKPFHLRELMLRIQNILKRSQELKSSVQQFKIGFAIVDFEKFIIKKNNQEVKLTHKECALLKLLIEKQGKVVSRDEILDKVWSKDEFPSPRTVDNMILKFRKIIEDDSNLPKYILSVRGVGYQLMNAQEIK
jgi:two-component system alkaline phosphatase synthesis response regulator PhoP